MEWDKCHCGKEAPENYKPTMCCNEFDCGCRGLPTEPYVCSEACWNKLILGVFEPTLDVFKQKPTKKPEISRHEK